MAILDGIFGFAAKPRGDMGTAVVNRLLKFATKAGRVVSSLITVDDDGNLSTPGRVSSNAAVAWDDTYAARFGHADHAVPSNGVSAPFNRFGFFQTPDGQIGFVAADDTWIISRVNTTTKGVVDIRHDQHGILLQRGGGSATREPSAVMQLAGGPLHEGGFLPPKMPVANRDAIVSPAAGLIIYNSENGRLELYDGSAWVGLTTEP